jgi:hypothetical protein
MSKDNPAVLKQSFVGRMLFLHLILVAISLATEPASQVNDGSVVLGTNITARAPFNRYARDASVRIIDLNHLFFRHYQQPKREIHDVYIS